MTMTKSIENLLKRQKIPFTPIRHALAYTAQREAAVAHVQGRHWAKTVVCFADGQPVQAVVPADQWVDLERLRELISANTARLADESEVGRLYPGYDLGAMPPFGSIHQHRVVVDKSFVGDPEMVFAAGTHTDAICMHYNDFAELVKPLVGTVATRSRYPLGTSAALGT